MQLLLFSLEKVARGTERREKNEKKKPLARLFLSWRRRGDLNPRAGFPTYTLSRGASSAYLSTSPNMGVNIYLKPRI